MWRCPRLLIASIYSAHYIIKQVLWITVSAVSWMHLVTQIDITCAALIATNFLLVPDHFEFVCHAEWSAWAFSVWNKPCPAGRMTLTNRPKEEIRTESKTMANMYIRNYLKLFVWLRCTLQFRTEVFFSVAQETAMRMIQSRSDRFDRHPMCCSFRAWNL